VIAFLIRARYVSCGLAILLLFALFLGGRHVEYEQSIQSFFADDDPAVVKYKEAASAFGNDQFVFVGYHDPNLVTPAGMDRVAELAREIGPDKIQGVVRVESLEAMPVLWQLDDALLALERIPTLLRKRAIDLAKKNLGATPTIGAAVRSADARGRAALRRRMVAHPLFEGTVIDARGEFTALVARLKAPEQHDVKVSVAALRAKADAFAKKHNLPTPAVSGPPVLLADGFIAIEQDGRNLALAGMLLIGLVTLSATRSVWWAVVPLLAGWLVWLSTETVLSLLHLKLSLSGGPLVAQIVVLTMPAASHLALHFRDDTRRLQDHREAATLTMRAVTGPILWCAATGAIGYGALLTSNVVPVRQFGAVLAVCTAVAAILTLAISPLAMLPPFRFGARSRLGTHSHVGSAMNHLTARVVRHPVIIVTGTLAVVLPLSLGVFRLRYESNYINAFKPDARVVRDYHTIEERLGGIGLVYLVVPMGETLDVAVLERFRRLDGELAKIRRPSGEPAASHVISLATVLDPDGKLAALDVKKRASALKTKLELIEASPQSELLGSFWSRGAGKARTVVRLLEQQSAGVKGRIFDEAERLARTEFGAATFLTGLSHLLTQTTRGVIATQWSTFTWATISILIMLTLAFRGPKLAILAILPTMLAVSLALGLMGWLGIKLDLATALVASVALGLSVDDTFHCLLQFRRHQAAHDSFEHALFSSYAVTGPGVLLSSLAVAIGFLVLRFSEFVPFSNFGTMVGVATAGSSLGNLVLLPACLALGNGWGQDSANKRREAPPRPAGVAVELRNDRE
jgi:predicted RND superfamily exporter protein